MTRTLDAVERRLDELARRHWSFADDKLSRLTLGMGDDEITLYARAPVATAFVDTLTAASEALHDADAELTALRARVATLERQAQERAAPSTRQEAAAARRDARRAPGTLEDVPAALVAPFRPDARTLAVAKKDPLVALAVQATKAMQADASELERARLNAMAYAASTGDLDRFWTARAQRSTKTMHPTAAPRAARNHSKESTR